MSRQESRHLKSLVGANLKAARQAKGLKHRELAQLLGIDQASISRWERGQVTPSLTNLALLSDALGRDVAWFYTDHDLDLAA